MIYIFGYVAIIFFYLIGNIVHQSIFKILDHKLSSIFIKTCLGILFSTVVFSLFLSHFKTINLIIIFLLIIIILEKKNWKNPLAFNKKELISTLKISLFIFPIFIIQLLITGSENILIDTDKLFYSRISYFLTENGTESVFNNSYNIYPDIFNGTMPYHYFELWLNSLLSFFFIKNVSACLVGLTYPILLFIFFLGILSIIESHKKINSKDYILGFLLIGLGPVFLNEYKSIFESGNFYLKTTIFSIPGHTINTSAISYFGQKHLTVIIVFLASYLIYKLKKINHYCLIILLAPVISIGLFSGVFCGLTSYQLYNFIKLRNKQNLKILAITISTGLLIIFFYLVTGNDYNSETSSSMLYEFGENLNLKGEILRFISKIFFPIIWEIILYFPFILLYLFFIRKKIKLNEFEKIVLLIISFSLFTFPFIKGMDASQFYTYSLPLLNLLIMFRFINLYSSKSSKSSNAFYYFFLSVVLYCCIFTYNFSLNKHNKIDSLYSDKYEEQIEKFINKNEKFASIADSNKLKNTTPANWYSISPGKLFRQKGYFNIHSIDQPNLNYDSISTHKTFTNANQMKFFNDINNCSQFNQCQIDFLRQKNINYIIRSKNSFMSDELKKITKIVFIDSISGESLYKVNF